MKFRPRRAALACALTATSVALALAASAQANTTLPGNNGKIAFTTNAFAPFVAGPVGFTTRGGDVKCPEFGPYGAIVAGMPGFDILACTAEIATVSPDGTGFTQVTNNDLPDDRPAWVPGGGPKLAYQSTQLNDDDCFAVFCGYNLYDIAPDGTNGHQLTTSDTSNFTGRFNASDPSYSPDGSKLVYDALNVPLVSSDAVQTKQDPVFKQFNHVLQTLFTIPAGGEAAGTATPLIPADEYDGPDLISDSQPTYSPDGSTIAFVRMTVTLPQLLVPKVAALPTITSSIYTVPATGGTPTPVESTDPCAANINTIQAVLTAAATGAAPARGVRGFGQQCTWDSAPAWSPDGKKIAVERVTFPSELLLEDARASSKGAELDLLEDSDIVTFNAADGSGLTDLSDVTEPADCDSGDPESTTACAFDQKPAWSPDGTKIAFFSDRNADGVFPLGGCDKGAQCDDEIWTMNADGSSPAQVTNNDVDDINPDWQSIPIPPAPPVQPAAPQPVKPKVGVAGVRRACVSKTFHVRFRVSTANSSVKKVVVKLDGHRIRSTSKGSFTLTINGKKLKAGKHRLTITATNAAGQVTTTRKSFSVCKAAKPRHKAAPRFTG